MKHAILFVVFLGATSMAACSDEAADDATPATAETPAEQVPEGPAVSDGSGPGGELVLTGAVDATFSDVGWTVADYDPPPDVDVSGFVLWLYERDSGRFENALTLSGIPYDTPMNTPVNVGPEADEGQIRALYVVDAIDSPAERFVAVSGNLVLTEYDSELGGRLDLRMVPADGAGRPVSDTGEPALTVTGSFRELPMIEH